MEDSELAEESSLLEENTPLEENVRMEDSVSHSDYTQGVEESQFEAIQARASQSEASQSEESQAGDPESDGESHSIDISIPHIPDYPDGFDPEEFEALKLEAAESVMRENPSMGMAQEYNPEHPAGLDPAQFEALQTQGADLAEEYPRVDVENTQMSDYLDELAPAIFEALQTQGSELAEEDPAMNIANTQMPDYPGESDPAQFEAPQTQGSELAGRDAPVDPLNTQMPDYLEGIDSSEIAALQFQSPPLEPQQRELPQFVNPSQLMLPPPKVPQRELPRFDLSQLASPTVSTPRAEQRDQALQGNVGAPQATIRPRIIQPLPLRTSLQSGRSLPAPNPSFTFGQSKDMGFTAGETIPETAMSAITANAMAEYEYRPAKGEFPHKDFALSRIPKLFQPFAAGLLYHMFWCLSASVSMHAILFFPRLELLTVLFSPIVCSFSTLFPQNHQHQLVTPAARCFALAKVKGRPLQSRRNVTRRQ
jgi:hypothetical protein